MSPGRASPRDFSSSPQAPRLGPGSLAPECRRASLARVVHSPSPTVCPNLVRANATTFSFIGVSTPQSSSPRIRTMIPTPAGGMKGHRRRGLELQKANRITTVDFRLHVVGEVQRVEQLELGDLLVGHQE